MKIYLNPFYIINSNELSTLLNFFKLLFKNYYNFGGWYLLGIDGKIINSKILEQKFINFNKLIKMAENLINSYKNLNLINSDKIKYYKWIINSDKS